MHQGQLDHFAVADFAVTFTMGFKYVFVPASPNDDMQAFWNA